MSKNKEFTMTQEQFDIIIDACKLVPMIMLQCGEPRNQQENANSAWQSLGKELGFKWDTVHPNRLDQKKFTAEIIEEDYDASTN